MRGLLRREVVGWAFASRSGAGETGLAMSQENVEVVRRWLAIFNVGPEEVRAAVA